jgi:spermidine/putrescine-binding protein
MTGKGTPGVTFDEALTQKLSQAGWTRRDFLARVAAVGAYAALTQLLIACGGGTASPSSAPPATGGPTPAGTTTGEATPGSTAAPTPVPQPESELFVYNWSGYIGKQTVQKFEDKYGIKVTYDKFPDEATQISKIQSDGKGGGYDVTYPASTWIPSFAAEGVIQELDHSLIPNLANLAVDWQNPGYDPGNGHSVPHAWWTTGYAWDPRAIDADLTSWGALWDPAYTHRMAMLDDMRECFAAAAFRLGLSPNTTDVAELDRIVGHLQEQKPLLARYTADDIGDMVGGVVDLSHCWSGDWVQMTYDVGRIRYAIPSEGSIKGSDTYVVLAGAQHPIAAHLWIDFNLDAQISSENTNWIGYMGPNEAAKPLIDDYILEDPRLNPPPEILAELIELQFLEPADLAAYTDRWTALRAS